MLAHLISDSALRNRRVARIDLYPEIAPSKILRRPAGGAGARERIEYELAGRAALCDEVAEHFFRLLGRVVPLPSGPLEEEHIGIAVAVQGPPALVTEEQVLGAVRVVAREVTGRVLVLHPYEKALHLEAGGRHLRPEGRESVLVAENVGVGVGPQHPVRLPDERSEPGEIVVTYDRAAAGLGAVAHAVWRIGEEKVDGLSRPFTEDLAAVALDNLVYEAMKHASDSRLPESAGQESASCRERSFDLPFSLLEVA